LAALAMACGCSASTPPAESVGCEKDTDCKGARICVNGVCTDADGGSGGAEGGVSDATLEGGPVSLDAASEGVGSNASDAADATLGEGGGSDAPSGSDASGASDAGCATGTLSCNGQQPTICTALGTWQSVGAPCSGTTFESDPVACVDGACVQCAPSWTRCVSWETETDAAPLIVWGIQTCLANDTWPSGHETSWAGPGLEPEPEGTVFCSEGCNPGAGDSGIQGHAYCVN
jgi:hypothetical protein